MTRAELEDLIKLHNETIEEHISRIYYEWRTLRWNAANHARIIELRNEIERLKNEIVELKELA